LFGYMNDVNVLGGHLSDITLHLSLRLLLGLSST